MPISPVSRAGQIGRAAALTTLLLSSILFRGAFAADFPMVNRIVLGMAAETLNGPWKFHTGDNLQWAEPGFDDSAWEPVDLTPPVDAHDSDVGLTGYVPGWQARGHHGYSGFAWYRLRITFEASPLEGLALIGPPYVDSAYQVFVNGRLVGAFGDFSSATPTTYGIHRPKFFSLDPIDLSRELPNDYVIAFRVWMGPWMLADPKSGGIYIAPSLGTTAGASAIYQARLGETIRGYVVDAAEAVIFWLLALVACALMPFDRSDRAVRWMAAALVFVGIARANQAMFFWWQFESFQGFEILTGILMIPLSLGAWTLAWHYWVKPRYFTWLPATIVGLTLTLMVLMTLRRSWFYGAFPPAFDSVLRYCSLTARLIFLTFTFLILFRILIERSRDRWLATACMASISVGLFASELSLIGIPGIWFPFGVGVSRTEYAYVVCDFLLIALLLRRLYSFRSVQPAAS